MVNVIKVDRIEVPRTKVERIDLASTDLFVPVGRTEIEVMTFKKPLKRRIKEWLKRA